MNRINNNNNNKIIITIIIKERDIMDNKRDFCTL